MIYLQDVFDALAHGELANVKIGNSDLGTLGEKSYPRVIGALNLALIELYKRLNLRQNTLVLHQHASVVLYKLRSAYADEVTAMDDEKYIEQTIAEPFQDDVLKVLSAVDSAGDKVRINNALYPADIFTPQFDEVRIIGPSTTVMNKDGNYRTTVDTFTITYQAKYPKIVLTQNFKPLKYQLHIPDAIIEPLLLYTAHRLMKRPTKLVKGEVSPQSTLLLEYENAMKRIELVGMDLQDDNDRDQFTANGWA
jgi:hypothetical protein